MTIKSYLGALILLLTSCAGVEHKGSPLVVVPGIGIPGRAEVGMTISELQKRNPDIEIDWAADSKLWKDQGWQGTEYSARIPSLKTHFWAPDEDYGVDSLNFIVDPTETALRFVGQVAGINFAAEECVSRDEIVATFGSPTYFFTNQPPARPPEGLLTNMLSQLQAGHIVSWNTLHGTETLYYPRDGITFNLVSSSVVRVVIKRKIVEQAGPAYPPHGVGSADP